MKGSNNILKQAQKMQRRIAKIQEELENVDIEGRSGDGMVTVTANGKGEVLRLEIDPEALESKCVKMLEALILEAIRNALRKSTDYSEREMRGLTP
jgi:hypothetical protein